MVCFTLFFISYCLGFGTNDLAQTEFFLIELQKDTIKQDQNLVLPVSVEENVVYFLPQEPTIYKEEILLPIPEKNFYLYFKNAIQPTWIFAPKNTKEEVQKIYPKTPIVNLPTGVIGQSCITDLYFVFQIYQQKDTSKMLEPEEPENRLPAILYPETKEPNLSKIYYIQKSKLQKEENPFLLISETNQMNPIGRLYCTKDWIFLFYKISDTMQTIEVYDFNKTIQKYEINLDFLNKNLEKVLIETVEPFLKDKQISFLIEVSFRNPTQYQINKKVLYELRNSTYESVLNISDFNFSLLGISENSIFLGSNESEDLLLRVYNFDYQFMRKSRIVYRFDNNYWKEFFFNNEGRFFSTKIEDGFYKIIEWK